MAGTSVANRSETVTVPTPRGPVEVVRQQWRSQRPGNRWNWSARAVDSVITFSAIKAKMISGGKLPSMLNCCAARTSAGVAHSDLRLIPRSGLTMEAT